MINFTNRLVSLVLFCLCFSCSSYRKIPYFQDLNISANTKEDISNFTPLTIQAGDILGVNVTSLNPDASAIFNYNLNRVNGNNIDNIRDNPVIGYMVDLDGNIQLPLLGNQKAAGLTTIELQKQLKPKLVAYLKEPVVNIRILNFKVSVFGDVGRPDVYPVQNERITIPEALSLAGDLNITAIRNNVLLIREKDGKREYIPIDLTSKKLFASPYFYLKNNDVIYVQPDRTKFASVDQRYQNFGLVLSALSVIAIILTRIF